MLSSAEKKIYVIIDYSRISYIDAAMMHHVGKCCKQEYINFLFISQRPVYVDSTWFSVEKAFKLLTFETSYTLPTEITKIGHSWPIGSQTASLKIWDVTVIYINMAKDMQNCNFRAMNLIWCILLKIYWVNTSSKDFTKFTATVDYKVTDRCHDSQIWANALLERKEVESTSVTRAYFVRLQVGTSRWFHH